VASAVGIVFPRFRPVRGTVATGSTTRHIAVVPPIAIGLLPIALVERRGVIHSPTVRATHGNNLVARAGIWRVVAGAEELEWATGPVAQVWEIGLAADQTASGVEIFPGVEAVIEMPSVEALVGTTDPARGQVAVEVHQAWALAAAEVSAAVAVASVAAVAVGGEGNGLVRQKRTHRSAK
jgi:hypothetical protein